jgi:hypothetical protein
MDEWMDRTLFFYHWVLVPQRTTSQYLAECSKSVPEVLELGFIHPTGWPQHWRKGGGACLCGCWVTPATWACTKHHIIHWGPCHSSCGGGVVGASVSL